MFRTCAGGRTLRWARHHLSVFCGGRFLWIAAALNIEIDHLERAFILEALVPRTRRKDSQRVSPFGNIPQFERPLVQFVISFVRLIVENHMNVIPLLRRRILVRHVAFQIAAQLQLNVDRRAVDGCVLRGGNDFQRGLSFVLLATGFHHVDDLLWARYDRKVLYPGRRNAGSCRGVRVVIRLLAT